MTLFELRVHLCCRSFFPENYVRGRIEVYPTESLSRQKNNLSEAALNIEWIAAQLHCHVSVDTDILPIPIVTSCAKEESILELPDVSNFSGKNGTCIYASKPTILMSDFSVEYSMKRKFALSLPHGSPPSFRGSSARLFYILSMVVKPRNKPAVALHLSFDVYATTYSFSKTIQEQDKPKVDQSSQKEDELPVPTSIKFGEEAPLEIIPRLMHGRHQTELYNKPQTSVFSIGKDNNHLVNFVMYKQEFYPGDVIFGTFDFTNSTLLCHQISSSLIIEEYTSNLALTPNKRVHEEIIDTYHHYTTNALSISVRLQLPIDITPGIDTDLVNFKWKLRFEFLASTLPSSEKETVNQFEMFEWKIPLKIIPPIPPKEFFFDVDGALFVGQEKKAQF